MIDKTQKVPNLGRILQLALEQASQDTNTSNIGVSVGVVTPNGKWTGASGISNLKTQQATQPEDLFNIASIGKAYTSAIILKLQEQGKLSLDDTLNKWLPDIAAKIPNSQTLTIRQLLDGTSGLFDYTRTEKFQSDLAADYSSGTNKDWRLEDLVAYTFGKPLFSGEGSTEVFTYPNTGYAITASIAEKATGKPLKQILKEEIIEPLELKNTFFSSQDVSPEKRAKGYGDLFTADRTRRQDGILEDYTSVNTRSAYGDGSIVSSAEDVAIFFNSLASGDSLNPASTAEIFNYVDTGQNTGRPDEDKNGLGIYPDKLPWGETRSRDGGDTGYSSQVDYFLGSDTTISVLVNQGSLSDQGFLRPLTIIRAYRASVANALRLNDDSAINGTQSDDYLTGTSNNDAIYGSEGKDILVGKKGLDALDGGVGDDVLEGSAGDDYLFGKEGNDNLYGDRDNDFLNGGAGDDLLEGGKDDDFLVGGDGNDTISGGKDFDVLSGGAGNDLLRDTQGNNSFYGNDGDDLLFAGNGDDALYGDAGSDRLVANAGNDRLLGGSGNDYLNSGKGDDTLTGGDGGDRFALSLKGTDILTDFTQGEDLLELPKEIGFAELKIRQGQGDNAANTLINLQSETLAVLNNINSAEISQSNFFV